jgi:hypothetical protein
MKARKILAKFAILPEIHSDARQDPIENPLWDLMLFTNDCYPGCSCERDFFDMKVWRVQNWQENAGEDAKQKALQQIEKLIHSRSLDLVKLTNQVNYCFGNLEEAIAWLIEWRVLLSKTTTKKPPLT